ncbi:MAG: hypothetical protein KAJ40_05800 [Alphaproteobacteria bacterium]|nr:hypothetical protein [Alphaproteobacteria bacterium]
MNAGIVILQDETPCIVYDEELPCPVRHVEFDYEDHQITLVYDVSKAEEVQNLKFDFPLDRRFLSLLEKEGSVTLASIKNEQLVDIKEYSVIFLNRK